MKRLTLTNGFLSLTAVALLTCCVDDKYDISNVDTTSRFTVDNLTVPINLSEIKLENVINLDDNENIEKIMIDGKESYAIVKGGDISTSEFSIGRIHVAQPSIDSSSISVALPAEVTGDYIPGVLIDVPVIALPSTPVHDYKLSMKNVDQALQVLRDIKSANPIKVEVVLSVPQELLGAENSISFQNLEIQLPWGLITDSPGYNQNTGMFSVSEIQVDSDGKARLSMEASGLDLKNKGTVENGTLDIEGEVGIESGEIKISVKDVKLPSTIDITADYYVSSFDITSFSGTINYEMDAIDIDPISLSDLPDFLDNPETNIIIANPQILISIQNPVSKYYLHGSGVIKLTSIFKNGKEKNYESAQFSLIKDYTNLAFCTPKDGYSFVAFDGLRELLSSDGDGLPQKIKVNIHDIIFKGNVEDFPLENIGKADGSYKFNAPLGFGAGSKVVYETTENGWSSDELDDVNINNINVKALCSTNLPVGVQLSIKPIDKYGNEIAIKEESALFEVPAKGTDHPVELSIQSVNGPIKNFDGLKFRAIVRQDNANNTEALAPDLFIKLSGIRVTVDGYYETDF